MPKKIIEATNLVDEHATPDEIKRAIEVLDRAFISHIDWGDALNVTLVCRQAPDKRDLLENAHRECRFGQWYYNQENCVICRNPNFLELEERHKSVHRQAAHLLQLLSENKNIPTLEYVDFTRALNSLRQQMLMLKADLEDAIHNVDPLTGASSRIGMISKLEEQHARVRRKLESCVIVMMDIDLFKNVNDKYGHIVGDRALATFAHHVMRHTRPFDRFFRYGGEEFLLCAPHTDIDAAHGLIERIRVGLTEIDIPCEGYPPFRITASFGMTLLDPDVTVVECIDRCDLATYAAKQRGRNQTAIWDPSMDKRMAS